MESCLKKLNVRRLLPAASTSVLALIVLNAAPAQAAIPEGNLLGNPGAENGPGAAQYETVPPPGWTTTSNFTVVAYQTDSGTFPTTADSAATGGGANFFAGGNDNDVSTASQTVDVSASAPEIDAGGVKATVRGLLGGFVDQGDNMTITAAYVNANGATQGTTVAGPVTPADRNNTTGLLPRSTTGTVPPGTRSIVVTLTATRIDGFYNDGYVDNVELTLAAGPPPPPVYQGPTSDKTVKVGEAQVVLTSPRACVLPSARFRVGAREKRKTASVRGRIYRVGLKQVDFSLDRRRVARDRKEPFVAQFRTAGLVPGSRHAIKAALTVRVKDPGGKVTFRRGTVRASFRMCV